MPYLLSSTLGLAALLSAGTAVFAYVFAGWFSDTPLADLIAGLRERPMPIVTSAAEIVGFILLLSTFVVLVGWFLATRVARERERLKQSRTP